MDKTESPQPEQDKQSIPLKTKEEYLADVAKYCQEALANCSKATGKLEKAESAFMAARGGIGC